MKEYRLELKVKNGLLWRAMKDFGHDTVAELSRASGVNQHSLGEYMNLKKPPMGRDARPTPLAQRLCDYFGVSVDEIFPPEVILQGVPNNVLERWASSDELVGIGQGDSTLPPDEMLMAEEQNEILEKALSNLSDRERRIVDTRLKGSVPRRIVGDELGICEQRVSEIEWEITRKVRKDMSHAT